LVQGWNKFRDWHDLPPNVRVDLEYLGDKKFDVLFISDAQDHSVIPGFHSRSLHKFQTDFYDVDLTISNVNFPKLVRH
jgi:hypothetical protein